LAAFARVIAGIKRPGKKETISLGGGVLGELAGDVEWACLGQALLLFLGPLWIRGFEL
jgi:hypothetical protein